MLAIHDCLAGLARKRPLFHSEADFQLALAWQIQQLLPDSHIRLELPIAGAGETRRYLDIAVQDGAERILIELKYKTRDLEAFANDELFLLLDQGAQPLGRYDNLKDIERLESMLAEQVGDCGYAILLSNDHGYWTQARSHTVDAAFRLHESSLMKGVRHWGANAKPGTTSGHEDPIPLRGNYRNRWRDYSRVSEGVGGRFRYLLHEVRAS